MPSPATRAKSRRLANKQRLDYANFSQYGHSEISLNGSMSTTVLNTDENLENSALQDALSLDLENGAGDSFALPIQQNQIHTNELVMVRSNIQDASITLDLAGNDPPNVGNSAVHGSTSAAENGMHHSNERLHTYAARTCDE